ncbi:UNVERIFIED_CONTAM: hypothetical protein GTU68_049291 [Idotea baltica]|nr:hypothetical protein [Idotea baltica]
MTDRPVPKHRDEYRAFRQITTRWKDNDVFGHVNNVNYYSFFDTVVCGHLMETGALHYETGDTIAFVVETQCNYFSPIAFPDLVTGGLRVERIGGSSVRYGIGLFREDEEMTSAAGHFIHVYVDRETRRPKALPDDLRAVVEGLV